MSIAQCIGRPRDKSRDVAIEKAAVELLREVGYEHLPKSARRPFIADGRTKQH
jgi:hypothetical protein